MDEPELDALVQRFWRIETEGTQPNNYFSVLSQVKSLTGRLERNPQLRDNYRKTLQIDLKKNHVEPVEMQDPPPDRIWYLPHHPVENPNKPCKVRRVENAASKFRGQSLNTDLLTGPDLLNSFFGVLMRFRENQIAVLADIEGMFMQIAINQTDQSALRFLWKNDNEIQQYQFTRIIFGATCSPSCAIYVLNHCVDKNGDKYPEAVRAVKSHFYMDDYIQSHDTVTNATQTVQQTIHSLQEGGFRLKKFVSDEPVVLKNIPTHDIEENSEIVRVLGQKWNLKSNTLIMKPLRDISPDAIEYSQRKIFSLVCSIFDPLGILSTLTIRFKILLQEIWKLKKKWMNHYP